MKLGSTEREMKEDIGSGKVDSSVTKTRARKSTSPEHDILDDMHHDEESMDWWTKYFASIDRTIKVY